MLKIELRGIKHAEFASEETHCYSATLVVDGVVLGSVSNEGHGGCDMFHAAKGATFDGATGWDIVKAIDARIAAEFPKIDMTQYGGERDAMDSSLEIVCGDLVNDFLAARRMKRLIAKKVVMFDPATNAIYTVGMRDKKAALTPALIATVASKNPARVILNTLPEAEALAYWRKAA